MPHRRQGYRLDQEQRSSSASTWSRAATSPCWRCRGRTRVPRRCLAAGGRARRRRQLGVFFGAAFDDWLVARTGYTGEDGYEIMLPADAAAAVAGAAAAGVRPAALARATRCGWKPACPCTATTWTRPSRRSSAASRWTVHWEPAQRDFIGRAALAAARRRPGAAAGRRGAGLPRRAARRAPVLPAGGRGLTSRADVFGPTVGRGIGSCAGRPPPAAPVDTHPRRAAGTIRESAVRAHAASRRDRNLIAAGDLP